MCSHGHFFFLWGVGGCSKIRFFNCNYCNSDFSFVMLLVLSGLGLAVGSLEIMLTEV